jgi:hypothetical protein
MVETSACSSRFTLRSSRSSGRFTALFPIILPIELDQLSGAYTRPLFSLT